MYEALEELKSMRKEMEQMRADMQKLRWKMLMDGDLEEDSEEAKEKRAEKSRGTRVTLGNYLGRNRRRVYCRACIANGCPAGFDVAPAQCHAGRSTRRHRIQSGAT